MVTDHQNACSLQRVKCCSRWWLANAFFIYIISHEQNTQLHLLTLKSEAESKNLQLFHFLEI